jgi:hypothetical protein
VPRSPRPSRSWQQGSPSYCLAIGSRAGAYPLGSSSVLVVSKSEHLPLSSSSLLLLSLFSFPVFPSFLIRTSFSYSRELGLTGALKDGAPIMGLQHGLLAKRAAVTTVSGMSFFLSSTWIWGRTDSPLCPGATANQVLEVACLAAEGFAASGALFRAALGLEPSSPGDQGIMSAHGTTSDQRPVCERQ